MSVRDFDSIVWSPRDGWVNVSIIGHRLTENLKHLEGKAVTPKVDAEIRAIVRLFNEEAARRRFPLRFRYHGVEDSNDCTLVPIMHVRTLANGPGADMVEV